ncbi:MAG: hypothetical protein B9S33_21715 [Pedosphaera sp. Tous-C6FEB]|nr:MAG: hypothetical protein B9S33_21715 [Pedosphaera sp. Tous-C6FEB]
MKLGIACCTRIRREKSAQETFLPLFLIRLMATMRGFRTEAAFHEPGRVGSSSPNRHLAIHPRRDDRSSPARANG